ncbi:hypothetical protein [Fimbriiglobus ruber]|uniref:Uncharacterized protein n=1 Tax=Fimbriiglobus ruber TaxID=1908690 RepID=A0A225E6K1_9BACT|nr:hypothetical protein [Fimbriiglobus ruber]OWK47394.1 hypothetical protein FRUB_01093 [Fimbriiglobus ruber]
MTLAETLQTKLGEWKPAGDGRHSWAETFADSGWAVRIEADRTDTLGCQVWEVALDRVGQADASLTLSAWADRIAASVTGLPEKLKVVEIDQHQSAALLRSDTPGSRGNDVLYFEVRLAGLAKASIRRFKSEHAIGARREQIPFIITHEGLAKVVGDIAG